MNKKKTIEKKETKEMILQERNLLKITLEYMAKENESLKIQLEDMKITARSNKLLLKEYVEKITNKDNVVEKMNNTIEQLQSRLQSLEDHTKTMQGLGASSARKSNRSTLPLNIVINSNQTNINMSKGDSNMNMIITPIEDHITGNFTYRNSKIKDPLTVTIPEKSNTNQIYIKEFFTKQNKLFEELEYLKNILMLNKNYSQVQNKILSNIFENRSDQEEDSSLSLSFNDAHDKENSDKLKKINLNENYEMSELDKLLMNYDPDDRNILLFMDRKNNIWELIKRCDLNVESLKNPENLKSYKKNITVTESNFNDDEIIDILNISLNHNHSDHENSKNSEVKGTKCIKNPMDSDRFDTL